MKRTIKFRAKTINGKWVEGDLLHGQGAKEGNMYILPQTQFYPSDCHNLDGYQVDPETVSQYTGRDDDFGTPIYEGDILDNDDTPTLVKWYILDDQQGYWLNLHNSLKVVGNKWDNQNIIYVEFIDKDNPKL